MLKEGTLSLQLNARGAKNREIVAVKRFTYEDLPEKMKTFGSIEKVFKYLGKAKYIQIDPASATVTVLVHTIDEDFEPVEEFVLLSLEKQQIEIKTEQLLEEIDVLKARIENLERGYHQPP